MDEVIGGPNKCNEEFYHLCSSPNTIRMMNSRRMRWAGHVVRVGVKRNASMVLSVKSEGKLPLGKLRLRKKNDIKMDLEETGLVDMDLYI